MTDEIHEAEVDVEHARIEAIVERSRLSTRVRALLLATLPMHEPVPRKPKHKKRYRHGNRRARD